MADGTPIGMAGVSGMTRDLRARVDHDPECPAVLRLWLGDLLLRSTSMSPNNCAYFGELAEQINAMIDARVTELLEANNREVERRRDDLEAEAERLKSVLVAHATPAANDRLFHFPKWAADRTGWDPEIGAPGIALFNNAVQVWAIAQQRPVSVADAARAFNIAPARIVEAVEEHYWMFLDGPEDDYDQLMIEHEGE